ncbi:hypothetical protein J6590_007898 [Homalodisca vitripennis]|nr:hypothetical protein J6590_007898 [Homalodisca vitripennis]
MDNAELRFEPMTDELSLQLQELCQGAMPAGEMKVYPSGSVLTRAYQGYAHQILDMEVREDDIWVITFPKSGKNKILHAKCYDSHVKIVNVTYIICIHQVLYLTPYRSALVIRLDFLAASSSIHIAGKWTCKAQRTLVCGGMVHRLARIFLLDSIGK